MSDRGDVTFTLFVERDKLESILLAVTEATFGDVKPEVFDSTGEHDLLEVTTEWLSVENSEGTTQSWFEAIIGTSGLAGLEIRNSLSHGVETWRWTMALGPWHGTLDYELGDVISLDDVMATFEQARHEPIGVQLEAAWRILAETVGYNWISALTSMALFVKRPLDEA